MKTEPHIVIVGGGAGGLELATTLGNSLGRKAKAKITLVDQSLTHIWKPLLHEVAAGTLNNFADEVNYIAHSYAHHFNFLLGSLSAIDKENKTIQIQTRINNQGEKADILQYDILVIAIGGTANNFNTPGADEFCYYLDSQKEATRFHQLFLQNLLSAQYQEDKHQFDTVIIGGGATGVELAAELHTALVQASHYGIKNTPLEQEISITIVESAGRLLANLPEKISAATQQQLIKMGITVLCNECVTSISEEGVKTASGKTISSHTVVWAAGVKGPKIIDTLKGFDINKRQQILVKPTLQVTTDDAIFALGDCAACPLPDNKGWVPARAQAAHQQASCIAKSIKRMLKGKDPVAYRYKDYGSLISLSHHGSVGNLMGKMIKTVTIEGWLARMFYLSLYKMHLIKLHGYWQVAVLTLANIFSRRIRPRLKLH